MQDTQTEANSTMGLLQNELEKKWAREQMEERLADEPLGPEPVGFDFEDELAHYEFHDIEAGDVLEWDDGEVDEVIGIVPAQQTAADEEPLGDIVHVRVLEEMDDADEWDNSMEVGEQNDIRDYSIGGGLARGEVEIRD